MLLRNVTFNARSLSRLLHIDSTTVMGWCRRGHLKAEHDGYGCEWKIMAKDVVDFLYYNPKYQERLRKAPHRGISEMKKEMILQIIDTRPALYPTSMLVEMFCVDPCTVRHWVQDGLIEPLKQRPTYGEYLFTENAIDAFLKQRSRYWELYADYMEEKKYERF